MARNKSKTIRENPGGSKKARAKAERPDTSTQRDRKSDPDEETGQEAASLDAGDVIKGLTGTTVDIVSHAASVLEEELSRDITIARKLENKYVNVDAARDSTHGELISRFRHDSHEVLDMFIDLVTVGVSSVDEFKDEVVLVPGGSGSGKGSEVPVRRGIVSLDVPGIMRPGQATEIPLELRNESERETQEFRIHCSDLTSPDGKRISARNIRFSPAKVSLDPDSTEKVSITVKVPKTAQIGHYSGIIQATGLEGFKAVLSLDVNKD